MRKLTILESSLQIDIKAAKFSFESDLVSHFVKGRSSKIYSYTRSVCKLQGLPPVMFCGSSSAQSNLEKATLFDEFFYSVYTTGSSELPPLVSAITLPNLESISVSPFDVYNALTSLDPAKAMGCDRTSPHILKCCTIALFKPISSLYCYIHPEYQQNGTFITSFLSSNLG